MLHGALWVWHMVAVCDGIHVVVVCYVICTECVVVGCCMRWCVYYVGE